LCPAELVENSLLVDVIVVGGMEVTDELWKMTGWFGEVVHAAHLPSAILFGM